MDPQVSSTPVAPAEVIVVGAGPVGLVAALALRKRHGLHVTVLEQESAGRLRPGSRAIFLHRVSLEILGELDTAVAADVARHGLVWSIKRTTYRGHEVYVRRYPPPRGWPAATNLSQVETEEILFNACVSAGVEFRWNQPVSSVRSSPEAVVVQTSDGSFLASGHVIGADGARSAVRSSIGVQLSGPRWMNTFVVVDVAEDPDDPLPVERVFHYEHPMVGYRNVLMVPFAGHWRIDLQCKPSDNSEEFSGRDGVRRWLSAVMPPKYADRVTWVTSYQFRQAIADGFADPQGRVLLVGEAGHVFAPFGARGLNSGIADAYVAAEAIARAAAEPGRVGASPAIEAFARTRRRAAMRNAAASTSALKHLTARSLTRRGMRWTAGHLAPFITATGKWMDTAPFGPPLGDRDEDGMRY